MLPVFSFCLTNFVFSKADIPLKNIFRNPTLILGLLTGAFALISNRRFSYEHYMRKNRLPLLQYIHGNV